MSPTRQLEQEGSRWLQAYGQLLAGESGPFAERVEHAAIDRVVLNKLEPAFRQQDSPLGRVVWRPFRTAPELVRARQLGILEMRPGPEQNLRAARLALEQRYGGAEYEDDTIVVFRIAPQRGTPSRRRP